MLLKCDQTSEASILIKRTALSRKNKVRVFDPLGLVAGGWFAGPMGDKIRMG